jgi:hypothetical protein
MTFMSDFVESRSPSPARTPPHRPGRRVLFLDDDPGRAEAFLAIMPDAVWVSTVEDCLARLAEPWDEVHLDHDLGGEIFVDCGREDCGMEIVRALCLQPHPHLATTRFYVHSHNPRAADLMVMQMHAAGYRVEARPFNAETIAWASQLPEPTEPKRRRARVPRWLIKLGRYLGGHS